MGSARRAATSDTNCPHRKGREFSRIRVRLSHGAKDCFGLRSSQRRWDHVGFPGLHLGRPCLSTALCVAKPLPDSITAQSCSVFSFSADPWSVFHNPISSQSRVPGSSACDLHPRRPQFAICVAKINRILKNGSFLFFFSMSLVPTIIWEQNMTQIHRRPITVLRPYSVW